MPVILFQLWSRRVWNVLERHRNVEARQRIPEISEVPVAVIRHLRHHQQVFRFLTSLLPHVFLILYVSNSPCVFLPGLCIVKV